jgi:hypothetical protein
MFLDNSHQLYNGVLTVDFGITDDTVHQQINTYLDVSTPDLPPRPSK